MNSDAIFATTDFLKDYVASIGGAPASIVENGVDYARFEQAEAVALDGIPRPRLGFIGGLKFKIDIDLIAHTAKHYPEASVILIGPVDSSQRAAVEAVRSKPNIHFLPAVNSEQVPGYVRALDVGMLPYNRMEYNRAVSPLKLFEYLAAGVPAVGTGLSATRKYAKEGVYYYSENDYARYVADCRRAVAVSNDVNWRRSRQAVASQHDWSRKFQFMLDAVYTEDQGVGERSPASSQNFAWTEGSG